jgi:hypothetical protein
LLALAFGAVVLPDFWFGADFSAGYPFVELPLRCSPSHRFVPTFPVNAVVSGGHPPLHRTVTPNVKRLLKSLRKSRLFEMLKCESSFKARAGTVMLAPPPLSFKIVTATASRKKGKSQPDANSSLYEVRTAFWSAALSVSGRGSPVLPLNSTMIVESTTVGSNAHVVSWLGVVSSIALAASGFLLILIFDLLLFLESDLLLRAFVFGVLCITGVRLILLASPLMPMGFVENSERMLSSLLISMPAAIKGAAIKAVSKITDPLMLFIVFSQEIYDGYSILCCGPCFKITNSVTTAGFFRHAFD